DVERLQERELRVTIDRATIGEFRSEPSGIEHAAHLVKITLLRRREVARRVERHRDGPGPPAQPDICVRKHVQTLFRCKASEVANAIGAEVTRNLPPRVTGQVYSKR